MPLACTDRPRRGAGALARLDGRLAAAFAAIAVAGGLVGLVGVPACYRPDNIDCVVRCGVANTCPDGMSCSNGFCTGGRACETPPSATCETCGPDAVNHTRCRGNVVLACDGTAWSEREICAGASPICQAGSCRQCRPGATRCQNGCVEPCDASGAWASVASCTSCALASPPAFQVAAGGGHTCAIVGGGQVRCWGDGSYGQLGLGDRRDRGADQSGLGDTTVDLGANRSAVTLAAGGRHTCALLDTAMVKCWGDNGRGQLGLGDSENRGDGPNEMGDALPAVDLGAGQTARAIAAGSEHSCALLGSGAVKCWGASELGQLGLGDTQHRGDGPCEMGIDLPAIDFGLPGAVATSVVAGPSHSCAILATGEVFCWGNNQYGQLGVGDTSNRGDGAGPAVASSQLNFGAGRVIAAIAAGYAHTCALDSAGAATCWGSNRAGQLGLENRIDWSQALNTGDPSVHLGGVMAELALGSFHSCARFATGAVKCWGLDTFGVLGLGATDDRGDDPGELRDALPAVDLGGSGGARALSLVAGGDHTCAVLETGDVKCWGLNQHGELGLGDTRARGDAPNEMGDALPALAF